MNRAEKCMKAELMRKYGISDGCTFLCISVNMVWKCLQNHSVKKKPSGRELNF